MSADYSFCVPLSFCQELRTNPSPTAGCPVIPASKAGVPEPANVHGTAQICFDKELCEIRVKLCVAGANVPEYYITAAHIHIGAANENGPIIATLYSSPDPVNGTPFNGTVAKVLITNAEIECLQGSPQTDNFFINSVASVYQAALKGYLYVNVHGPNPGPYAAGMIRGQIF